MASSYNTDLMNPCVCLLICYRESDSRERGLQLWNAVARSS